MSICIFQLPGKKRQTFLVLFPRCTFSSLCHEDRPFLDFSSKLRVPGAVLLGIFDLPRFEMVFPSLNRVFVRRVFDEMTNALPTVVLGRSHRCPVPICIGCFSPLQITRKLIMAI